MGTAVHPLDGEQTTFGATAVTTSYSTFSIASLIGNQQVSDDDRETPVSRISEPKTTVGDHPASVDDRGEDRLAVTERTTTTTTPLHDDAADPSDDDSSGGSRATATRSPL